MKIIMKKGEPIPDIWIVKKITPLKYSVVVEIEDEPTNSQLEKGGTMAKAKKKGGKKSPKK